MELNVCEKERIVYYWMSKSEKNNNELKESLKPDFKKWKESGYRVCVFLSGNGDITANTKELLVHNKDVVSNNNTALPA